jgi:hypothetical protein
MQHVGEVRNAYTILVKVPQENLFRLLDRDGRIVLTSTEFREI